MGANWTFVKCDQPSQACRNDHKIYRFIILGNILGDDNAMLRKRKPELDDRSIFQLVQKYLLPYARKSLPSKPVSRKAVLDRLNEGITYVVAANEARPPYGFINLMFNDHILNIDMLAVDHVHQGRGMGSVLIHKAEQIGRKKGCNTSKLLVDESNHSAMQFYFKKGYHPQEYVTHIRCFLLSKEL